MGTKRQLHERSPPGFEIVPASQRRRLSFSNCDLSDNQQLKALYELCLDQVLRGLHPVSRDTAIRLASIQCFIQYGPFYEGVQSNIRAFNLLPKEYFHAREHEKNIIEQYRSLIFPTEIAAQRKYCDICKNLPTYGMIFFNVREPIRNRLLPRLLGVNKECVMSVDKKNKVVLKSWPLEQIRRWAASPNTFNIDFGDYQDGYYSVQTSEGEKIKKLIAEFVDIIIIKKQLVDPFGLEGDEGAIMIEDFVHRARSVPLSTEELQIIQANIKDRRMSPIIHKRNELTSPECFVPSTEEQNLIKHYRPMTVPLPIAESPKSFQRLPSAPPVISIAQVAPSESPAQWTFSHIERCEQPPILYDVEKNSTKNLPDIQENFQLPPTLLPPPVFVEIIDSSEEKQRFQPSTLPSFPKIDTIVDRVQQNHFSAFTSNQIAYEICHKEGISYRSYEQHFENTKDLQALNETIEHTTLRLFEFSKGTFSFNPSLKIEENASAIRLDSIRHKSILFLACCAQAIEWTSESQRFGPKYGSACKAIHQGGDFLCDILHATKELIAIVSNENFTTQLLSLVDSVTDAFVSFLGKLHPEANEKRSHFLSSANLLGENVFILLNSLNADEIESTEEQNFFIALNEAIQTVANSAAGLVLQAKTLPGSPTELSKEIIIKAATRVALSTSETIALTRVLTSIMAHPACQRRIQRAANYVFNSTKELLELAKSDAFDHFSVTGGIEHYENLQRHALNLEMSLDQLIVKIKA